MFVHYSHATFWDNGEIIYSPLPLHCPPDGGTLQAPLALCAGLSQGVSHTKEMTKEKRKEKRREREKTKETA